MTKPDPILTAEKILRAKYPGALLAFAGGSFNRGEATAYSDIDLVVIFNRLEYGWRESFSFEGWPVEAFIHDPQTLRYFFAKDAREGTCILASMVVEGPAVPKGHVLATQLKGEAAETIAAGPPPWEEATITEKRYQITNIVDDLRDPRNPIEAAASIGALYSSLGEFYLRTQRLWSAGDKHISRRLAKANPDLAHCWSTAFLKAWAGERAELLAMAEDILAPYGGLLFNGYKLPAPADWRMV